MTAPDPRAWLDQVDARTNAATDGPWDADLTVVRYTQHPDPLGGRVWKVVRTEADATFVAHARTDLPAATTALRNVLDLHADDGYGDCTECGVDTYENAISHPCPTVTAITTALEDA